MLEKISRIIYEHTDVSDIEISANTSFVSDLHLNSFEIINLVVALENELKISIPDDELRNLFSVGDIIKYADESRAAK